jgi:xanthine dehydrogenase accessory factor
MNIIARINELIKKGQTFCLATVITSDRPHISTGLKIIVLNDGSMSGGLGAERLDLSLRKLALAALHAKKPGTAEIEGGICIFIDIISPEASLLVCGAGHIAIPLVNFAQELGFRVTVLDDRSDFAHPSRFPDCTVIAENFTIALQNMSLGPSTVVVIITRGHEHDVDCLTEILQKETAYVGLIGSRRRVHFVLEWLEGNGFPRQRLKEVFTPIGIPIGAESPEEIALSIASELVCVRRKGSFQARNLRAAVKIDR